MSDIIKYANLNAKVKGMFSKNLKQYDYEELIKQYTVKDSIIILKNKIPDLEYINENSNRREIEEQLSLLLVKDIEKINRLLDKKSKQILQAYIQKYEIRYLKEIFIELLDNKPHVNNIKKIWATNILKEIQEFNNCQYIEDFIKVLDKTIYAPIIDNVIEPAVKVEDLSIFKIENAFDKIYFQNLYHLIQKEKNKTLIQVIGKQIDLLNLLWIYRIKKFHNFTDKQIQETLININYKLSKQDITKLMYTQDYQDILSKTIYQQIDCEHLEESIQRYLNKTYELNFRENIFDITMIICYMELKEIEIKNIITIIEGIRYGLNKEILQMKII